MEFEQQGEDSVLARVVEGTPFDMPITLSAEGGTLSSTGITVEGGDIESETVVVTPDEGSTEVTVSVESSDLTGFTNYFGLVWEEADPLVIGFEEETETPEPIVGELPSDDPPVNFRITGFDDDQVGLQWEISHNRGITSYVVYGYDHDGTGFAGPRRTVTGDVGGGGSVAWSNGALTAATLYRYDLALKDDAGTVIIEKSLEVRTLATGAATLSSDSALSSLALSGVELDPDFSSAAYSYAASIASEVAQTR